MIKKNGQKKNDRRDKKLYPNVSINKKATSNQNEVAFFVSNLKRWFRNEC